MTRQTDKPLYHHSLNPSNRAANFFFDCADWFDIDPPYQRGSVWTDDQRIALVRSWMQGVPIPAIIINDRGTIAWEQANPDAPVDKFYAVIDGKQRILTARAWFGGELAVPASWFEAQHVEKTEDTSDGPYTRYTWLTIEMRRHLGHTFQLPTVEARLTTVEDESVVYLLVNGGGTPQTETDLARAATVAQQGRRAA